MMADLNADSSAARKSGFSGWAVPGTAAGLMAWAIARAYVQAVTIDEANTYIAWVAPSRPAHWEPFSNNHVLNSLLIRLFTSVFGLHHLTLRAPALMGAAIYFTAAYYLSKAVARTLAPRWVLFICLAANPLVFDYLVAARGYSLALGFFLSALALAAHAQCNLLTGGRVSLVKTCALCSGYLAASFAANFSFAFADASAMIAILAWACRCDHALAQRFRLVTAAIAPGVVISCFISIPVALHMPKAELKYGSASLKEMLESLSSASLYELNPQILHPRWLGWLNHGEPFLFPLLGACVLFTVAVLCWSRPSAPDGHSKWARSFGALVLTILASTFLAHWLAFSWFGLPLPKDRTALFFVPLVTILVGLGAAIPMPRRAGKAARLGLLTVMTVFACYFLFCCRLTYFKEWKWDSEVDKVYPVLAYYNRTYGVRDVVSHWRYGPSLNFYRLLYGNDTISEIQAPVGGRPLSAIYVLCWDEDRDFIRTQGLRVVYRGDETEVVVAIRPEADGPAETAGAPVSHRGL
jgi:hypothetical protein